MHFLLSHPPPNCHSEMGMFVFHREFCFFLHHDQSRQPNVSWSISPPHINFVWINSSFPQQAHLMYYEVHSSWPLTNSVQLHRNVCWQRHLDVSALFSRSHLTLEMKRGKYSIRLHNTSLLRPMLCSLTQRTKKDHV